MLKMWLLAIPRNVDNVIPVQPGTVIAHDNAGGWLAIRATVVDLDAMHLYAESADAMDCDIYDATRIHPGIIVSKQGLN